MISTPQYETRRVEENGQDGNEARLQMVSDWLNITPSKDFPLFSPTGPVKGENTLVAEEESKIRPGGGAYTPTSQLDAVDDTSVLLVSQLQLHTKQPLPINGRTIYSLQGTRHSNALTRSLQSHPKHTTLSTTSTQSTALGTPVLLEPSFVTSSPEFSTVPGRQGHPLAPSASSTPSEDEFTFCYPSFLRTRVEVEEDVTRPASPTPIIKSRYDPSSNPWALPKLLPPFTMKPTSELDTSPLTSLPSTRDNTPDKKLPRRFKPSAIMLSRDWIHDRRAYECHRYGTRSRMSEKGLAEASLREVNWDLEKIRGSGIGINEKLFVEPVVEQMTDTGKRKRASDASPTSRSPKKKREDSQPRKAPLGRPPKKKVPTTEMQRITTAKSEEVAVSLALDGEMPSEPKPSSASYRDIPSSPPASEPEPDDDDDEYIDSRRPTYRKRVAARKSAPSAISSLLIKSSADGQADTDGGYSQTKKPKEVKAFTIDLSDPSAIRTFPSGTPINSRFPLLYRRFPVCSFFEHSSQLGKAVYAKIEPPKRPQGNFNQPHTGTKSCWNLYQPRYVKGSGNRKEGLCPLCKESPERGGLGKNDWYEMKTSAFNYHLQKFHGISPTTGLPFSPPVDFRRRQNAKAQKHQKKEFEEGLCHNCKNWIPLEGPNLGDSKVKELYWWKHACGCHKGSMIEGERDFWYDDEVAQAIREYESRSGILTNCSSQALPSSLTELPSSKVAPAENLDTDFI